MLSQRRRRRVLPRRRSNLTPRTAIDSMPLAILSTFIERVDMVGPEIQRKRTLLFVKGAVQRWTGDGGQASSGRLASYHSGLAFLTSSKVSMASKQPNQRPPIPHDADLSWYFCEAESASGIACPLGALMSETARYSTGKPQADRKMTDWRVGWPGRKEAKGKPEDVKRERAKEPHMPSAVTRAREAL